MSGSADFFNEMREPDGSVRDAYSSYCDWYDEQDASYQSQYDE